MHYFHNFSPVPHLLAGQERFGVVLACFRAMTKKVVDFFGGKKCTPEKILAMPMNLPTPGKNPAGAHAVSPNIT